eukprot:9484554-Pyramimonas_sp.AAC.1
MATISSCLTEIQGSVSVLADNEAVGVDGAALEQIRASLASSICAMVTSISQPVFSESAGALLKAL